MASIDQMRIQGIRRFHLDNPYAIKFLKPVTIIVGPIGSGKTTIIECLNYALTGALPPNTSATSFVLNPRVAGNPQTLGVIRLRFKTANGETYVIERKLQTKMEGYTLYFDGSDSALKLDGQIISDDVNERITSLLGVSESVLSNVLLVHQDDANWPLSELNKRIFSTTKYHKAVEIMRQELETVLEVLKEHKSVQEDQRQVDEKNSMILELEQRLVVAQSSIDTLEASLATSGRDKIAKLEKISKSKDSKVTQEARRALIFDTCKLGCRDALVKHVEELKASNIEKIRESSRETNEISERLSIEQACLHEIKSREISFKNRLAKINKKLLTYTPIIEELHKVEDSIALMEEQLEKLSREQKERNYDSDIRQRMQKLVEEIIRSRVLEAGEQRLKKLDGVLEDMLRTKEQTLKKLMDENKTRFEDVSIFSDDPETIRCLIEEAYRKSVEKTDSLQNTLAMQKAERDVKKAVLKSAAVDAYKKQLQLMENIELDQTQGVALEESSKVASMEALQQTYNEYNELVNVKIPQTEKQLSENLSDTSVEDYLPLLFAAKTAEILSHAIAEDKKAIQMRTSSVHTGQDVDKVAAKMDVVDQMMKKLIEDQGHLKEEIDNVKASKYSKDLKLWDIKSKMSVHSVLVEDEKQLSKELIEIQDHIQRAHCKVEALEKERERQLEKHAALLQETDQKLEDLVSNIQNCEKDYVAVSTLSESTVESTVESKKLLEQCEDERSDEADHLHTKGLPALQKKMDELSSLIERLQAEIAKKLNLSEQIDDLNKTIKSMWQQAYQGRDPDFIQINVNENKAGRSYRIEMRTGSGVDLDMVEHSSGGQKVMASIIIRLALFKVFGTQCGILVLDEPTASLDEENYQALAALLRRLVEENEDQPNFQLIVATHNMEFAKSIAAGHTDDYYLVSRNDEQYSLIECKSLKDDG